MRTVTSVVEDGESVRNGLEKPGGTERQKWNSQRRQLSQGNVLSKEAKTGLLWGPSR